MGSKIWTTKWIPKVVITNIKCTIKWTQTWTLTMMKYKVTIQLGGEIQGSSLKTPIQIRKPRNWICLKLKVPKCKKTITLMHFPQSALTAIRASPRWDL